MGGIAVVIDWERSTVFQDLSPMLALIPHRSAGGVGQGHFEHAALGEARRATDPSREPTITTIGYLSIVGALRLWDRAELRSRAGGDRATRDMDDRRLLLEAYRRSGIGFLEAVNGDFAFVIWDSHRQEVLAVEDRFGVKPLFYEQTSTGIRFASEPKQLVATSHRPPTPNTTSVVEYLAERYEETRFSFFEGVNRIRPSTYLIARPDHFVEKRYWNPERDVGAAQPTGNVAAHFREHLIDAVRRRVNASDGIVGQLSGGFDSASIAASAHLLEQRNELDRALFRTVSAVFPGFECDESVWIDEVAASQPFGHVDFVPEIDAVSGYEADMWEADGPSVQRWRGFFLEPAKLATNTKADLIVTGSGGDDVLDQDQLLADLLRAGRIGRWLQAAISYARWSDNSVGVVLGRSVRNAAPTALKREVRQRMPRRTGPLDVLIRQDAQTSLDTTTRPLDFGFPTQTQNPVIANTQDPLLGRINHILESEFAYRGLDVSHPYLDRVLVEYVASIPPLARPQDIRTKALVRAGFLDALPSSVLNRRTVTVFGDYHAELFIRQAPVYRTRYPQVPEPALEYLDTAGYDSLIRRYDSARLDRAAEESLWRIWSLLAWLDGLERYNQYFHGLG